MYNKEAKVDKDSMKSPRNPRQSFSIKAFSVTINWCAEYQVNDWAETKTAFRLTSV